MSLGVYNQVVWPGVGDVDDCWVIATLWTMVAAGIVPDSKLPSVLAFRTAAGVPDVRGRSDGGTNQQILKALNKLTPNAGAQLYSGSFLGFGKMLSSGWMASVAVNSAYLPAYLQFGFKGAHQVAVIMQGGQYYVMNPLARQGSALLSISAADLQRAAGNFIRGANASTGFMLGDGKVHAVMVKVGGVPVKVTVPDAPKIVPLPVLPQAPLSLQPPTINYDILHPWDARDFYDAKHKDTGILARDARDLI